MAGAIVSLLFFLFLLEWPLFMKNIEARTNSNSDPLVARIRMARLRAGLPQSPTMTRSKNNDKHP